MKLTLIRGLPGSGKSTLATTMPAHHVEADMYFVQKSGDYVFDVSRLEQAHRWCQQQTEQWLSAGEDVVVSNTFVRLWEMKAYQRMARRYGAELEVITCKGEYPNIHGVSQDVIARMRRRWQE